MSNLIYSPAFFDERIAERLLRAFKGKTPIQVAQIATRLFCARFRNFPESRARVVLCKRNSWAELDLRIQELAQKWLVFPEHFDFWNDIREICFVLAGDGHKESRRRVRRRLKAVLVRKLNGLRNCTYCWRLVPCRDGDSFSRLCHVHGRKLISEEKGFGYKNQNPEYRRMARLIRLYPKLFGARVEEGYTIKERLFSEFNKQTNIPSMKEAEESNLKVKVSIGPILECLPFVKSYLTNKGADITVLASVIETLEDFSDDESEDAKKMFKEFVAEWTRDFRQYWHRLVFAESWLAFEKKAMSGGKRLGAGRPRKKIDVSA